MIWKVWLLPLILSYLLGAIPFSYLIARSRGVDLRKVGSGNVGATNVFRSVGRSWGLFALTLDILKGYAATAFLPGLLTGSLAVAGPELSLACGFAAVTGHTWPVFIGFRGGKGAATGAGMLMGAAPQAAGFAVAAWIVVFIWNRRVSLATMVAAVTAAGAAWALYPGPRRVLPVTLTALAALVLWRHRANWARLRAGTEPRLGRGGSVS